MEASEEGDTEIIELLLKAGATANKTKKVMYTTYIVHKPMYNTETESG